MAGHFKTELLTNFGYQITRWSQSKIIRVLSAHQPSESNNPTRAVSSGIPNSSTQTFPRKMTTAENNQPCDVMSVCRVRKV